MFGIIQIICFHWVNTQDYFPMLFVSVTTFAATTSNLFPNFKVFHNHSILVLWLCHMILKRRKKQSKNTHRSSFVVRTPHLPTTRFLKRIKYNFLLLLFLTRISMSYNTERTKEKLWINLFKFTTRETPLNCTLSVGITSDVTISKV